jgi:serine/threonine-protein kinase
MRITLTVTAGPHRGRVFAFAGHDTFLLGRSRHAHFRMSDKDRRISRVHFLVELNPPQCRLTDMGSRNGTYVNGDRVETSCLKDGDRIRVGRTVLRVSIGEAEVTPAPVSDALPPPAPPRPPPLEQTVQGCRVCRNPLSPPNASQSADRARTGPVPLCSTCREQIRTRDQPIAGYRIVQELGHGAMGVVYLALRAAHGAVVALKTIKPAVVPTPNEIARFRREASILYALDHPHIVAFRDMGECRGQFYFAMDYVRGTDAGRLVKGRGPMSVSRGVGLVCQLLQALDYAHAKGFVHRDIKPSNLLVADQGERELALLADFGLARVYHDSRLSGLTLMGDMGGTVPFMAPEQITDFRNARPTTDQYGVGATLYQLLTGHLLYDFPAGDEERLLMILHKKPVPIRARRPDIPQPLAEIIHRALAKDPANRFVDVRTMRRALLRFCQ